VYAAPVTDDYTILVVANAIVVTEVELVDLDFIAFTHRHDVEGIHIPVDHTRHVIDHCFSAVFWRATRWASLTQRLPATQPRGKAVDVRQFAIVINMRMGEKDVIYHR